VDPCARGEQRGPRGDGARECAGGNGGESDSAINKNNLHDGKVRIDSMHTGDVDLRVILDAVRSSRDGEYVTVQNKENDVRVAKSADICTSM